MMRKLFLLALLLASVADAKLPKGCACNGLQNADQPTVNVAPGTYSVPQNVTVSTITPGGVTRCTTDGITTPTPLSPVCATPVVIGFGTTVLQAITTVASGYNQSTVFVGSYTVQAQALTPVPNLSSGTYVGAQSFSMTCASPTPTMYFTTDSSTPTFPVTGTTTLYSGAFNTVSSGPETIKYICTSPGFTTSPPGTSNYNITGAGVATCPVTVGGLVLNAKVTRSNGISPLLVFFDATATTSSNLINANTTAFQDVTYTWNFGDAGASGTGTWAYGSNPNGNSKNTATGGIAAHLFICPDNGGDCSYTAQVTGTDGTNTATCNVPSQADTVPSVVAYDPAGANGFPGAATTCYFNSTVGGLCPAGATQTTASTFNAIGANMAGKRALFKCGDTFASNSKGPSGSKWSIGAYGNCAGTPSGRPVFNIGSGSGITWAATVTDGRFSDIDVEGSGVSGGSHAFPAAGSGLTYPSQLTLNNVLVNNTNNGFYSFGGHENGWIQYVMANQGNTDGTFINSSENQCSNGSAAYNCGGTPAYASVNYQAIIGSSFNGTGATAGGPWEVVRISAGRFWVIENSTIQNGFNGGAALKFHDGNAGSQANWTGQYNEFDELSDNLFTGTSGAQMVEIAPQNNVTDERLRNIVFERNHIKTVAGANGHCYVMASVKNGSFRDNVFNSVIGASDPFCLQIGRRGFEGSHTSGAPVESSWPQYDEVYNNTCYGTSCLAFSGAAESAPGNNGWAINTLFYRTSGSNGAVANTGSGNTLSNNTSAPANNPLFTNAAGFTLMSDYKPTNSGAYLGGINSQQPIFLDALGITWQIPYDLGAVKH